MQFEPLALDGLVLVTPRVFRDERGFFLETFRRDAFDAAGITVPFVQDNHSRSRAGTIRGLHFQRTPGQAKLVRCTVGRIWDVAVDIRPGSPTLGRWMGVELDAERHQMLYIPVGFAHGFAVLSDWAEVQYKCSAFYDGATEAGIAWDDPAIGVDWRVHSPVLSERDRGNPTLAEFLRK
jgi:dTDP-4-dehydrorhamnose 3,5-epimerase